MEDEIKAFAEDVKKENKEYIDGKIENVSKDVKDLQEAAKSLATKEDLEGVSNSIKELKIERGGKAKGIYHFLKTEAAKELERKANATKSNGGKQEILKAVGTVSTVNATGEATMNDAIASMAGVDVSIPELEGAWIDEYISVANWSRDTFKYAEWRLKEGAATHVAEGALKPQIDIQLVTAIATATKAAAWMELSEEAELYLPDLMSAATGILRADVLREYSDKILNGDGVSPNPNGIINIATALDTTDWAAGVDSPNLYDIFSIANAELAASQANSVYKQIIPNLFLVNPKDLAALKVAKDGQGGYVFPPTMIGNQMAVDGVAVRTHQSVPAGTFILGDFKKFHVKNVVDYRVETGHINDQFVRNLFTLLGEKYYISFVKEEDKRAFVKGDIAAIKTAIQTPDPV